MPKTITELARMALLLAGVGMTSAQDSLEAPFTRVTEGLIATEVFTSEAAAWGDYDDDGWLDLFVANNGENVRNSLFHNSGDGTFVKVTTNAIVTGSVGTPHVAAWADYDNDGLLDLITGHLSGPYNPLYRNLGGGRFVRATVAMAGDVAVETGISVSTTWADYDNDGFVDLFIGNGALLFNQYDFLFHNEGDGRLMRTTGNAIADDFATTTQGSWADYDNDGDLDLMVTHTAEQGNKLFRNDGRGQFTDITEVAGVGEAGLSVGAAWGDYDNDGDFDLIITNWRNPATPRLFNLFYQNNGDGTFTLITEGEIANDSGHFLTAAWIDYDNDGWLDLFLSAERAGEIGNRLYRNLGNGHFLKLTSGRLVTDVANPAGASWGDYNNDGFLDVIVANGGITSAQRNGLYRNNANKNSWIKLKLVGTRSNRSAIGAKVRLKAKIGGVERWQMRQVSGG